MLLTVLQSPLNEITRIFSVKAFKKTAKILKKKIKKLTGCCRTKRQKLTTQSSLQKKFKLVDKIMMQNPLATASAVGCQEGGFLGTNDLNTQSTNGVNLYLTGNIAE